MIFEAIFSEEEGA